jgi:hypothetical protein
MLPLFRFIPERSWRAMVLLAAYLVFNSGRASAECGDYITIHVPALSQDQGHSPQVTQTNTDLTPNEMPVFPLKKQPCHGPNCSKSPTPNSPLAPVVPVSTLIKEVPQQRVTESEEGDGTAAFPRDYISELPIRRSSSIYHPPRID